MSGMTPNSRGASTSDDETDGSPGLTEQVREALDERELVELALDLASIPGRLGQEDAVAEFLEARMDAAGCEVRRESFTPGRSNVVGIRNGTGGGLSLMFNAHLETGGSDEPDVIPAARLIGDELHGHGIVNMRASLAAYVAAASAVRRAGISLAGDVLIAATAGAWDETPVATRLSGGACEGYGVGLKHLLNHGVHADFCVVGEPTSFKIVRQHYGIAFLRIDVRALGSAESVSVEDLTGDLSSRSSPARANRCLADLLVVVDEWLNAYRGRYQIDGVPPQAGLSAIEGGYPWRPGAIQECVLYLWVGTAPDVAATVVVDDLNTALRHASACDGAFDARAELYAVHPGPCLAQDDPMIGLLRDAHADEFGRGPEEAVVQWYSDAAALMQSGIPALNYGPPGRFSTDGQSMRVADLVSCARVYANLIVRVCRCERGASQ
jgi:acetylornithine deacetylase/succinyl-diaminopimelate desuccinylase-like protein